MVSKRSNTQERPVLWCDERASIFWRGSMYHNDSQAQRTYQFSFNAQSGSWVDKRVFFQFGLGDGFPDGMCVSEQGILYVAMWNFSCIERLTLWSLSTSKSG